MKKQIVYIAHPLSADTEEGITANRARASRWVAWAALSGVVPQATWVVLTGELSEEHRELGLELDCALVERCDEIWLVGGRVSSGMRLEAEHARRFGIEIRDFTLLGEEPPAVLKVYELAALSRIYVPAYSTKEPSDAR